MSNKNDSGEGVDAQDLEMAFFSTADVDERHTDEKGSQAYEETERIQRAPGPVVVDHAGDAAASSPPADTQTPPSAPRPVSPDDETQMMTPAPGAGSPAPSAGSAAPAYLSTSGDTEMMTPAPSAGSPAPGAGSPAPSAGSSSPGGASPVPTGEATQRMTPAPAVPQSLEVDMTFGAGDAALRTDGSAAFVLDKPVVSAGLPAAGPGAEPEHTAAYNRRSRNTPTRLPPAAALAPALPYAPRSERSRSELPPDEVARFRTQIDALVNEAKARAGEPGAAALWFEAGRIHEDELNDLVQAANHYQAANEADETFLPVIHAARRLFAKLNNWQLVVALIEKERALGGGHEPTLLVEKGHILETHLNQAAMAAEHFERALALEPTFTPAQKALQRALLKSSENVKLADLLENAASAETEPRRKAELYIELGRHHEARLGNDDEAMRHFEMAGALTPGRPDILAALRRLYARVGETDALAGVYLQSARAAEDDRDAVQFLLARARMLDLGDSLSALEEAHAIDPHDTLVLNELTRVYELSEDWESLARTLQGLIDNTQDPLEVVALHAEAGRILEEHVGDFDRAVANYRSCLLVDPSYQPAHQALGRLYAKTAQWDELVTAYDEQIAAAVNESDGVRMRFNQAELLVEHDQMDRAASRLEEILTLKPGYLPAAKVLSRIYGKAKRWPDLIRMYEEELKTQDDEHQAVFLLDKIGQLYEGELGDLERAADAYCRMRDRVPDYLPALRALGRIYSKSERWPELIAINTDESQIVGDRNHIVSLLARNGEIYADKLGDPDKATEAFTRALSLMPNYLPALKALGRIYATTGRFKELIAMHRQEAEVTRQPEQRAHLLLQVARIFDENLEDVQSAAKTFREILDETPTYHPAIRELARIAERTGDWPYLVEVYAQQITVMKEPHDRALTRCRAAQILERYLSRDDDAVQLYEDAIKDAPTVLPAHQSLIALHSRRGDAEREVKARERIGNYLADTPSRLANARATMELYRYRLERPDRALEVGQDVLKWAERDAPAIREVVGAALAVPDYPTAIRVLEILALIEPEASEAARCFLQAAALKEDHVDPPQDPLPALLRVLEYDPINATALRAVERHYLEREAWEGLYALYEREREAAQDATRIVDLSMKMGNIAERKFSRNAIAAEQFETALRVDENYLPAIARLKVIYGQSNKPEDELRMLAFEAQASKDPARAIEIFLEVGTLQRDRFENIEAAAESFFQVLARDPLNERAARELEALLAVNNKWPELARLYEVQAAAAASVAERIDYRLKAAHVLSDRLDDGAAAAAHYEEVLTLDGDNHSALLQLAELRFKAEAYPQAVATIERIVAIGGDPADIGAMQKRLGEIYVLHQDEPKKAITALSASLVALPDDKETRRLLARAYAIGGSPQKAFDVHQQLLADAATNDERRQEHLALADLYETTFSDLKEAAEQIKAALPLCANAADQKVLLDRLVAMYERAGDVEGYVQSAEQLAADAASTDPEFAAQLYVRCAQLIADKADYDRAAAIAQGGLNLLGEHQRLRVFLADLYTKIPTQAARAIEEHRRIVRNGNLRTESLHALYQLWTGKKAYDRAYVAAELLSTLKRSSDDEDLFLHENERRVLSSSGQHLEPGEITSLVLHPHERNAAHDVLMLVATDFGKVNPSDLSAYNVDKKNILNKRSDDTLRKQTNRLAEALGGLNYDVYRTAAEPQVVAAHNHNPPVLVVGQGITRTHRTRAQRFLLGQKVAALRLGHHLLAGMDADGCRRFFTAVGRAVDKSFPGFASGASVDQLQKRVQSAMSRSLKKALQEPVSQLALNGDKIDWDAFLAALPLTEARAGLLLGGDTVAALELAGGLPPRGGIPAEELRTWLMQSAAHIDLVAYALSDEHFVARQRLQFAIDA